MMHQFFIKHFMKKHAVKGLFFTDDHRFHIRWFVPKGNQIEWNGHMFNVTKDHYFMSQGVPTYAYLVGEPMPLNPHDTKRSVMTSEEFHTAINNKVTRDIFATQERKMDAGQLTVIFGIVMVAALGAVAYFGYEEIHNLKMMIEEIRQLLRLVGGM